MMTAEHPYRGSRVAVCRAREISSLDAPGLRIAS